MDNRSASASGKIETGPEVFRTGRTLPRAVIPFMLSALAVVLALGLIRLWANDICAHRINEGDVFGSVVMGIVALLAGFLTVLLILDRRTSFVSLGPEGLIRCNWRGRRLILPWSAVKRMTITDWGENTSLAIHYLDPEHRMRKKRLMEWDVEPLKEAIMRHKAFANRRERFAGFHEIYEE